MSSETLDDFDDQAAHPWDWEVKGSKFTFPPGGNIPRLQFVEGVPQAMTQIGDTTVGQVLGVHANFDRPGYHYVEIYPVDQNGDQMTIPMPGRVQTLSLWVWGSNLNYFVEVHFQDYRDVNYTLNLGDIKFSGWRKLRGAIPGHIPQVQPFIPQEKGRLVFRKIVVWTRPTEVIPAGGFVVYFDELSVLTDMFEARFDGDELGQPLKMQQLWGIN